MTNETHFTCYHAEHVFRAELAVERHYGLLSKTGELRD